MQNTYLCIKLTFLEQRFHYLMITPRKTLDRNAVQRHLIVDNFIKQFTRDDTVACCRIIYNSFLSIGALWLCNRVFRSYIPVEFFTTHVIYLAEIIFYCFYKKSSPAYIVYMPQGVSVSCICAIISQTYMDMYACGRECVQYMYPLHPPTYIYVRACVSSICAYIFMQTRYFFPSFYDLIY